MQVGGTMPDFSLDRGTLIFVSLSLAISCWALLDTERFLTVLSLGRKNAFSHWELMVIKVPGTVVILGLVFLILINLLHKR
jgi:hypothetical protein